MMVLDLDPFRIVNKPGFLRHQALCVPNFEVASDKYYRSMLDPTYEKIKMSLNERLEADSPTTIAVSLDGWSAFHHRYLGMNGFYLTTDWMRVTFCLGCTPFDESHTGENIYEKLMATLLEWNIQDKAGLCLRDNAFNVEAAFNVEGCTLKSAGCLNHTLQLVIHDAIFSMPSVKNLFDKCRLLVGFANKSPLFYTEFYRQQEIIMGKTPNECLNLVSEVSTRYVCDNKICLDYQARRAKPTLSD